MPVSKYSQLDKIVLGLTWCLVVALYLWPQVSKALIVSVITGIVLIITNYKMEIHKYHLFVLQFCLYCYATTFWSMNGYFTIEKGNTIFYTLIIMSIFYSYYRKYDDLTILIKIIMWAGYFVVFYSYFFYGIDNLVYMDEGSDRIQNAFMNVNVIGMLASLTVIFHLYFTLFEKFSRTIFLVIPAIIVIAATESRKAIIMLILGVVLLFFFKMRKGSHYNLIPYLKFFITVFLLLIIIMALSETGMFSGATERMNGFIASITGEGTVDSSTSVRELYRQVGWNQMKETPWFGIGIGCPRILAARQINRNAYLHCNYAEIGAGGGLVGLVSYYCMYVYIIVKEFKYVKYEKFSIIILIWVMTKIITDWGSVSYYSKINYFYLMIYFLHLDLMKKKYPQIK